ncbi:MAG: orotidine-5'-phosphate decarboxylase [Patescibacteria group bacterium]
MKNFADRLIEAIQAKKSYLCVGLDPQLRYFPPLLLKNCASLGEMGGVGEAILTFNRSIINATAEYAACYKTQMAFYEQYGPTGIWAFQETVRYAHEKGELVVEDAKRGDGGDTAEAYAEGHLGLIDVIGPDGELVKARSPYDVDAITIHDWIDEPCHEPFIRVAVREGKGVFVVDKTSFKPASRFQEMADADGEKGWVKMAKVIKVLGESLKGEHGYSPIGVVMGATYPEEAKLMRELLPEAFKLIPGFGVQGGGADEAVVCINPDGFGILPNNSRGTNYAWHPKFKSEFQGDPMSYIISSARETKKCRDALNAAVLKKNGSLPW